MESRDKKTIEGCPGFWTTNLDGSSTRDFYLLHIADFEIPAIRLGYMGGAIELRAYGPERIKFRDGECMWSVVGDSYRVFFKNDYEWSIIDARREERDELYQEESIGIRLYRLEDRHITELAYEALNAGEHTRAAEIFTKRIALRDSFPKPATASFFPPMIYDEAIRFFGRFTESKYGLDFFRLLKVRPFVYHEFAVSFLFRLFTKKQICEDEAVEIYNEGARLFPDDGSLMKSACLLWRRRGRLDLAIRFCRLAIANGAQDDTVNGFTGRLKRLESELFKKGRIDRPQCASKAIIS